VFWSALFVLGYALFAIGAGVILYSTVATVMGSMPDSQHRNTEEDEIWRDLLVTIGVAALWPVTMPVYWASRAAANAVSLETRTRGPFGAPVSRQRESPRSSSFRGLDEHEKASST
jgi:hypothetical protein